MTYYKNDLITVRSMETDDINIIIKGFKEQNWSKPQDVLEEYLIKQNNGKLYVFVAEYENAVAGYVVLYPSVKKGPFANNNIPEISDFNVFIKYQQKGIGNKILDIAEKTASEICRTISLGVGLHSGYGAAQRIYAKRGYVPDGSGVWYKDSPLEQYTVCYNDDDLVLYLSKILY